MNANSLENIIQEVATTPNFPTCSCHIINPKVHRLILWANTNQETNQVEYTLRIGSQRFTSLDNCDKNGQTYWRFQVAGFFTDQDKVSEIKNDNSNTILDQNT